ncbi:TPA: DEAD/DEAH box helicase, partial [Streptococcus pyogenes]|nr:DEAD/DEAH box helicase [Streptococcus pyogenes]
ERLAKRRETGLTTPKQIRMLERYGFKNVGMWKFEVASNMINRIAASGWRLPKGINAREYQPE